MLWSLCLYIFLWNNSLDVPELQKLDKVCDMHSAYTPQIHRKEPQCATSLCQICCMVSSETPADKRVKKVKDVKILTRSFVLKSKSFSISSRLTHFRDFYQLCSCLEMFNSHQESLPGLSRSQISCLEPTFQEVESSGITDFYSHIQEPAPDKENVKVWN